MKSVLLLLLVGFVGIGFAQDKKKCSQLPFADVDTKPELQSNLKKEIKDSHPVSFGDQSEHIGTYKVVVDCNGEVQSVMYRDGNYSEQEKVWMFAQLKASEWKAGIKEDKDVSSTVFVTVTTKELKTEVTIE